MKWVLGYKIKANLGHAVDNKRDYSSEHSEHPVAFHPGYFLLPSVPT